MKRIVAITLATIAFFAMFFMHRADAADDASAVWAREEAYWRFVKTNDNDSYRALWADDFVGWPIVLESPIKKSSIGTGSLSNPTRGIVLSYRLQRESVDLHGPVAVTFYRAIIVRRAADGSENESTERLSHTWMRRGDQWLIVAGMSAHEPRAAGATR